MSRFENRKVWIPEVSEKRIRELAERIKPLVRMIRVKRTTTTEATPEGEQVTIRQVVDPEGDLEQLHHGQGGTLYHIEPVDLFNTAYTWDPKPTEEEVGGLKPLADIKTHHAFGYHGLFKPSVAEVLAQIPEEYLDKVVAFEIVDSPETADDLNKELEASNAGYHVATTRLYARG